MSNINDKHRYYATKNSHEKQQYLSSHYNDQLNNKNPINVQPNSKNNPYVSSSSSLLLMPNKTIPSSTLVNSIPHERQSWTGSVKNTKINDSTEQKTQYLERMLRMSLQQKSSTNSSTFDRIRFANDQILTTTNTTDNNYDFDESSFHLIRDVNNHHDIYTTEQVLFNNEIPSKTRQFSNQIVDCESVFQTNSDTASYSAFLIDNCDEEELPRNSPPSCLFPSTNEELVQEKQGNHNEQRITLTNEPNIVDYIEQKKRSKRRKRLHKKLHKKMKQMKQSKINFKEQQSINSDRISNLNNNYQELPSDWIIEYDTIKNDPISELIDLIKRTSTTTTTNDQDKIIKVNIILKRITKQQKQLNKLSKHLRSLLNKNSTNTTQQNSDNNQDLLMTFLNQSITSGCWLCSGKKYTEIATQCNYLDEK